MSVRRAAIRIGRDLLERVYQKARDEFPAECCGWLAGEAEGNEVSVLRACVNRQAEGSHPSTPERSAETAYVIGGDDLIALNCSFDSATPAKVIYHSHPNGGVYLSHTDRSVATSPWGDGPAYPVQQLVIGLDERRVIGAALFEWADEETGFVEVARFDGAEI